MTPPLKQLLRTSYPRPASIREVSVSALLLSIIVYLFLVVYQPFGTYEYQHVLKYVLLIPYALVTLFVFSVGSLAFRSRARWTIIHESVRIAILLVICGVLNYLYNISYINDATFTLRGLSFMLVYTFAVGLPICALYGLGRYVYLKRALIPVAKAVTVPSPEGLPPELNIQPLVGKALTLSEDQFLFAHAKGNYCNVYFTEGDCLKKELFRMSLKSLEEQIGSGTVVRCHRSYILNRRNITGMKGNAQGYKVTVRQYEDRIPISRQYISLVTGDNTLKDSP